MNNPFIDYNCSPLTQWNLKGGGGWKTTENNNELAVLGRLRLVAESLWLLVAYASSSYQGALRLFIYSYKYPHCLLRFLFRLKDSVVDVIGQFYLFSNIYFKHFIWCSRSWLGIWIHHCGMQDLQLLTLELLVMAWIQCPDQDQTHPCIRSRVLATEPQESPHKVVLDFHFYSV